MFVFPRARFTFTHSPTAIHLRVLSPPIAAALNQPLTVPSIALPHCSTRITVHTPFHQSAPCNPPFRTPHPLFSPTCCSISLDFTRSLSDATCSCQPLLSLCQPSRSPSQRPRSALPAAVASRPPFIMPDLLAHHRMSSDCIAALHFAGFLIRLELASCPALPAGRHRTAVQLPYSALMSALRSKTTKPNKRTTLSESITSLVEVLRFQA